MVTLDKEAERDDTYMPVAIAEPVAKEKLRSVKNKKRESRPEGHPLILQRDETVISFLEGFRRNEYAPKGFYRTRILTTNPRDGKTSYGAHYKPAGVSVYVDDFHLLEQTHLTFYGEKSAAAKSALIKLIYKGGKPKEIVSQE